MIAKQEPCDDVILDNSPDPAALTMRLCNFETGSSDLLPKHREKLQREILDAHWRSKDGWIDIVGYASKIRRDHNAQANMILSRDRCASVQEFLEPCLPDGFRFNVIEGEGDTQSQDDPTENMGFFRAVVVRLFAQGYRKEYSKTRQPIPQPVLPPSDRFVFEAVKIGSLSIVAFQLDDLLFKLTDTSTGQSRYFEYIATGLNLGKSLSPRTQGWDSPERPVISAPFAIRDFGDFETIFDPNFACLGQGSASVSTPFGSAGPSGLVFQFLPQAYFKRHIRHPITLTFSFAKGIGAGLGVSGTRGGVSMKPADFIPLPAGAP